MRILEDLPIRQNTFPDWSLQRFYWQEFCAFFQGRTLLLCGLPRRRFELGFLPGKVCALGRTRFGTFCHGQQVYNKVLMVPNLELNGERGRMERPILQPLFCTFVSAQQVSLATSCAKVVYSSMKSHRSHSVVAETDSTSPQTLHLLLPIEHRSGMLVLICEWAPLLPMQCDAHIKPKTCPICGAKEPARNADLLPNRKQVPRPGELPIERVR